MAIILICIIFELLNISSYINSKFFFGKNTLTKQNYYKNANQEDPYELLNIQYLHPYYLSFNLWDTHTINKFNKKNVKIVQLDADGFRKNNSKNNSKKKIVLTGGSVAFGKYASVQENTIATQLNKKFDLNTDNVNSIFWSTHQELIGILKYKNRYDLSVSISLVNDVENFCNKRSSLSSNIYDLPINFYTWSDFIEAAKPKSISSQTFLFTLKTYFASFFKENSQLIKNLNLFSEEEPFKDNCSENFEEIANSFLINQIKMKEIANMRQANHITIIQPIAFLHKNFTSKRLSKNDKNIIDFYKNVISIIMESEYCKNNCYDMSKLFENTEGKIHLFSEEKNITFGYFYNSFDLLDDGHLYLSDRIGKNIQNILK